MVHRESPDRWNLKFFQALGALSPFLFCGIHCVSVVLCWAHKPCLWEAS